MDGNWHPALFFLPPHEFIPGVAPDLSLSVRKMPVFSTLAVLKPNLKLIFRGEFANDVQPPFTVNNYPSQRHPRSTKTLRFYGSLSVRNNSHRGDASHDRNQSREGLHEFASLRIPCAAAITPTRLGFGSSRNYVRAA
jgi:hypothetical protein